MGKLTEIEKRFVVRSIAGYQTPTEVSKAVRDKFGKSITPAGVLCYNPEKRQGRDLSSRLRDEFVRERERVDHHLEDIPIANLAYRLLVLQETVDANWNRPLIVLKALDAAREECEVLGNRHDANRNSPLQ